MPRILAQTTEPPQIVFFDMDGVLVLSEPLHYAAWFVLAEEFSFGMHDFMSFEESIGISDSVVVRQLVESKSLPHTPAELLERKRDIFLELVEKKGIAAPAGRAEFLDFCRSRGRVALVSSSSRRSVEGVLAATGLQGGFEFCVTGDDIRAPKPDPEPYRLALRQAGVDAGQALAVEDSASGIRAARTAGIGVLPFTSDFTNLLHEPVLEP